MERLIPLVAPHWFGLLLLGVAVALGLALLLARQRGKTWSLPLLLPAAGLALLGLGAAGVPAAGAGLVEAGRLLVSLEPTRPWWLLLLLLIPVIIRLSYRSLAGLGPVRRWLAIGLRCSLILFLTLALA